MTVILVFCPLIVRREALCCRLFHITILNELLKELLLLAAVFTEDPPAVFTLKVRVNRAAQVITFYHK